MNKINEWNEEIKSNQWNIWNEQMKLNKKMKMNLRRAEAGERFH